MNPRDETGFVEVGKLHLCRIYRALFGRSALRLLKDEAGSVIHAHLFGFFRDGIPDRLQGEPQIVPEVDRAVQPIEVEIERDKSE